MWYHSGIIMTMAMTLRLDPGAIREAAARRVREDRVRQLSAAARGRYADLLDRLGK